MVITISQLLKQSTGSVTSPAVNIDWAELLLGAGQFIEALGSVTDGLEPLLEVFNSGGSDHEGVHAALEVAASILDSQTQLL